MVNATEMQALNSVWQAVADPAKRTVSARG